MLKGNWWILRYIARFLGITTQLHVNLYSDFGAVFSNVPK